MAMTTCKECKAQISTTAESCPHCGAKPKKTSGCAIIVAIFLGLIAFSALSKSCSGSRDDDVPMPSATPEAPAKDVTPLNLTPEAKKAQREMAEAAAKAKPVEDLSKYTKVADEVEARLKENDQKLKKYYATKDQMAKAFTDAVSIAMVMAAYEQSKVKEEKKLYSRADSLFKRVSRQQRVLYASNIEQIFIDNGLDIDVSAAGTNNDQLRLKYVLMSRPLVYKFQNDMDLDKQAKTFGFKKIVFSDGYDESWTVAL